MTLKRLLGAAAAFLFGLACAELIARATLSNFAIQQRLFALGDAGAALLVAVRAEHNLEWLGISGQGPEVYDATLGWTNRVGTTGGYGYGNIIAGGIRRESPIPLTDNNPRVVVLGDSFAYGYGVADDEVIDARLEALLPETTIINLAVPGYSHEQILLRWRAEGMAWQPDAVLIVLVSVDIPRNGVVATDYLKPWASLDQDQLVFHGIPVPSPQEVVSHTKWQPRLWQILSALRHAYFVGDQMQLTSVLLSTMVSEVSQKVPVIVLLAPTPHEYAADIINATAARQGGPMWRAACPHALCIDGAPAIHRVLATGDDGTADGHWNGNVIDALAHDVAPHIKTILSTAK